MVASQSSDGKKKVTDTDTTYVNYPQKLLINQIKPVIIPPIDTPVAYGVESGRGTAHARQTVALKVIVTDAARSGARVHLDTAAVNQKETDKKIPWDSNTSRIPPRLISPVLIGGIYVSLTRTVSQEISSPSSPIGPVEVNNAQTFHTSINGNSAKHKDPAPTFSKVISR